MNGFATPDFSDQPSEFRSHYETDWSRVRDIILTSENEPPVQRTALRIMTGVYPLLRGIPYPEKTSQLFALRLLETIENHRPIELNAVLALPTAARELPRVVDGIRVFSDAYTHTIPRVLLAGWPDLPVRKFQHAVAKLTDEPQLIVDSTAAGVESLKRQWEGYGFLEENIEDIGLRLESKTERRSGTYLVLTAPQDFVSIAWDIRKGEDEKLKRDYNWLLSFIERQKTMQNLGTAERREAAEFGLVMRRGIAGRIQKRTQESDGLVIGLTTELNPRLLRCYGKAIPLLNIDVK